MDLIVTLDDATSEIYSRLGVEEEGTARHDVPRTLGRGDWRAWPVLRALHRSRAAITSTPRRLARRSSKTATNPGGKGFIASWDRAYRRRISAGGGSGRSERMFGTLQGRLPRRTLRLAGIENGRSHAKCVALESALPTAEHNKPRLRSRAEQRQARRSWPTGTQAWREALCVIEERTVANGQHRSHGAAGGCRVAGEPAEAPLRQ